jgi:hypothetical protein
MVQQAKAARNLERKSVRHDALLNRSNRTKRAGEGTVTRAPLAGPLINHIRFGSRSLPIAKKVQARGRKPQLTLGMPATDRREERMQQIGTVEIPEAYRASRWHASALARMLAVAARLSDLEGWNASVRNAPWVALRAYRILGRAKPQSHAKGHRSTRSHIDGRRHLLSIAISMPTNP